jgi:hypothetical protein
MAKIERPSEVRIYMTLSLYLSRDSANQAQRESSLQRGLTFIPTTSGQRSFHIRFKTQ